MEAARNDSVRARGFYPERGNPQGLPTACSVRWRWLLLLMMTSLVTTNTGCSVTGYYLGSAIQGADVVVPVSGCPPIDKGSALQLDLTDRRQLRGKYVGHQQRAIDDYRVSYLTRVAASLPELAAFGPGDTVEVTMLTGHSTLVRFLGLDYAVSPSINRSIETNRDLAFVFQVPNQASPIELKSRAIREIETASHLSVGRDVIDKLEALPSVPTLSTIVILDSGTQRAVPIDSLASIRIRSGDLRALGLSIGILIDAVVIYLGYFMVVGPPN